MDDLAIAGNEWGDLACVQCLHGRPGFEVLPKADIMTLAELLEAFGRDLKCDCGRLIWNSRTQTVTNTAST
jgi:hypothetical protein